MKLEDYEKLKPWCTCGQNRGHSAGTLKNGDDLIICNKCKGIFLLNGKSRIDFEKDFINSKKITADSVTPSKEKFDEEFEDILGFDMEYSYLFLKTRAVLLTFKKYFPELNDSDFSNKVKISAKKGKIVIEEI